LSRLGGSVSLSVAQLRVYLDAMRRLADAYYWRREAERAAGIREAARQLLAALNLAEDWAEEMDRLEAEEARIRSPVEVTNHRDALKVAPPEVTRVDPRIGKEDS
jgi:hypothetical protein